MTTGRSGKKARGRAATTAERRERAFELRKAGATFKTIGEQLGISEQAASRHISRVLRQLAEKLQEDAILVRQMEAERLDRFFLALWTRAVAGDVVSIDRALRIMERRAKLLGLDMPLKVAPTDPSGDVPYDPITDTERADRLAEILQRARDRRDREALVSAKEGGADPG